MSKITRRSCLFSVLLAPLVRPLVAIGCGSQPYDSLAVMGTLDGTHSVLVPKESFGWMVCNGWKISDKHFDNQGKFHEINGKFQMERTWIDAVGEAG